MKSLSGAIIVLSGSLIMGLSHESIPHDILPTLTSLILIIGGFVLVARE